MNFLPKSLVILWTKFLSWISCNIHWLMITKIWNNRQVLFPHTIFAGSNVSLNVFLLGWLSSYEVYLYTIFREKKESRLCLKSIWYRPSYSRTFNKPHNECCKEALIAPHSPSFCLYISETIEAGSSIFNKSHKRPWLGDWALTESTFAPHPCLPSPHICWWPPDWRVINKL